jgi:hypothetical protein
VILIALQQVPTFFSQSDFIFCLKLIAINCQLDTNHPTAFFIGDAYERIIGRTFFGLKRIYSNVQLS